MIGCRVEVHKEHRERVLDIKDVCDGVSELLDF
jgi:hypothetical protein